MTPHRITCDSELLRSLLREQLSEQQEESVVLHLEQCVECQQELERLAGQQGEWDQVTRALQQEAASSSDQHRAAGTLAGSTDCDFTTNDHADFAVDFLEPSSALGAIGRLGDVDILEVIGHGGMGVVLKGYQPELKRLVAVKVLAPPLAISGAARQRFAREAQATAAILHPNVVPILTVHSAGKLPYLLMPFLACESLQQRINRQGALDLVDVLRIGMQTAQGLAAAHAQGIVHRDVKPANILLEKGVDRVMLTDFGLARAIDDATITRTGIIAGTPQYMSPEQARGEALDARSDLFSLGSVLYTMISGRPPFRAESTYGILRRITDDHPRAVRDINPQAPAWFSRILDKLLAKAPADRFASAADVAQLLEQCLAHVQQPVAAELPQFCQSPAKGRRPKRLYIALAGGLLALLAVPLLWPPQARVKRDQQLAAPSQNDAAQGSSNKRVPKKDDPALRWDGGALELDDLDRDSQPFQTRVSELWDEPSVPDGTQPASEENLSPEAESKP